MWPDRVSNPGLLTYESGALPTALRGLAVKELNLSNYYDVVYIKIQVTWFNPLAANIFSLYMHMITFASLF